MLELESDIWLRHSSHVIQVLAELHQDNGWREVLMPSESMRHCLFVGCGIAFFSQATGIESVMYYTPETFQQAGMDGHTILLAATLAVGVVKLVATVVSALLLDDVGRRPLLIMSAVGVTFSLVIIAVGCGIQLPAVAVVGQCLFTAFFAVGYGPVCWTIIAEIFPLRSRGMAMSIATAINRFTSFLVALTWLSICKYFTTPGCYVLYAILNAAGLCFCITYVPETKGLSLEQISKAMHSSKLLMHDAAVANDSTVDDDAESSNNERQSGPLK